MKTLSEKPFAHETVEMTNVRLGRWTEVGEYSRLENTTFGDYSYSGAFCIFQNAEVGKFANIAAAVRIGPTMHPMGRPTLHHFTYRSSMYGLAGDDEAFFAWRTDQVARIGHDTWIGHGAIVMPGVSVGDGAVVGSGAVVTHDVPPYTIVAGVPARTIRRRFDEATAEALTGIAWWDWPHETLKERLGDFRGPVADFLVKYGASR